MKVSQLNANLKQSSLKISKSDFRETELSEFELSEHIDDGKNLIYKENEEVELFALSMVKDARK